MTDVAYESGFVRVDITLNQEAATQPGVMRNMYYQYQSWENLHFSQSISSVIEMTTRVV
jgi:hypothetical protein